MLIRTAEILLLTSLLAGCCGLESRFYQPETRAFPVPYDVEERFVENASGLRIQTWFLPAPSVREGRSDQAPALLFCPGSATQIDSLLPMLRPIADEADIGLMLVSYRGYGGSEDSSCLSRRRTLVDVRAAHRLLRQRSDVDGHRIAVMGYSLGAVPALSLAAEDASIPVVVVGGAYAYSDDALKDAGLGSWSWLVGDDLDPADSAETLAARSVLVFHGAQDQELPPYHAHLLAASLLRAGAETEVRMIPDVGHREVLAQGSGLHEALVHFLRRTLRSSIAAEPDTSHPVGQQGYGGTEPRSLSY